MVKWLKEAWHILSLLGPHYPEHGTNSRGASGGCCLSNGRSEFGVLLRFEEYERKQIIEEDYSI
jgi:hypothetical protein